MPEGGGYPGTPTTSESEGTGKVDVWDGVNEKGEEERRRGEEEGGGGSI